MTDAGATERLTARTRWWLSRAIDGLVILVAAGTLAAAPDALTLSVPSDVLPVAALLAAALLGVEFYRVGRHGFVSLSVGILHRQARIDALAAKFHAMSLPREQHYDELPLYLRRVLLDPAVPAEGRIFAGAAIGELKALKDHSWIACAQRSALLDAALERYFNDTTDGVYRPVSQGAHADVPLQRAAHA